ncbi:hypothetical protein MUN82_10075 [Hymenobacter aerilatus]|uniref:Uncharacterized protein n=1 Tax=Hymenobacter aerilatus TaxID=2932251 RepID=A0A8T9T5S3_9BACT|nr:hypothetical protein [Hymenobacter aerilatus]UOR07426.1 hypothetical protein MUN82_10075 [Hymenobacter aerilatus]
MFNEETLANLRSYGVKITGTRNASDESIIQNVQAFLPDSDFEKLALDLNDAARTFGFEWQTIKWEFSDGYINGDLLTMEYEAIFNNREKLILERRLSNRDGQLVAHHDYLCLPGALQNMNLSRVINGALYKQYKILQVRTIETCASLEVGGYVWAKAGFSAVDQEELDDMLTRASRLNLQPESVIKALQRQVGRHFTQSPGQPFPIWQWGSVPALKGLLIGSIWHGELNLYNQQQVVRFEEYLSPKP